MEIPKTSGPVFYEDHRVNLYYLNEMYGKVAAYVANAMKEAYGVPLNITSGVWGGTYLIAEPNGKSRRRIWRFYCTVNLPQDPWLEVHANMEKLVAVYADTFKQAFKPEGLRLDLQMWGGRLPHTNKTKPNITIHMEDASERIRWLRPILVWNEATWEQSILYDAIRLVKELKVGLNVDKGPTMTDPQEIKYLLQDVIITYHTLEKAHSDLFIEHAEPIIQEMTEVFLRGLFDPIEIRDWYHKILENMLVYGYEETLEAHYKPHGLDVRAVENWPIEKINWVPEDLKAKLIPPIQAIFAGFQEQLNNNGNA